MPGRYSKAICAAAGACIVAELWLLCLLSSWIIDNWQSKAPWQMSFEDELVEWVADTYDMLNHLYVPHLLTIAWLVWVVSIALRRPVQNLSK